MKGAGLSFLRGRNFPVPGIIKITRSGATAASAAEPQPRAATAGPGEARNDPPQADLPADDAPSCPKVSGVAGSRPTSPEHHSRHTSEVGAQGSPTTSNVSSNALSPPPSARDELSEPSTSTQTDAMVDRSRSSTHVAKFEKLLAEKMVDLEGLRQVAWSGIPPHLRPLTWRLLLGYLPANQDRRASVLKRKRREYMVSPLPALPPPPFPSPRTKESGPHSKAEMLLEAPSPVRQGRHRLPGLPPGNPAPHPPRHIP